MSASTTMPSATPKYFALLCLLTSIWLVSACQTAKKATTATPLSFPRDWVGYWSGTMTVYVAGKGAVQKVPMQLNIQPIKGSHNYTWNIVYGADGKDSRPYELLTIDSAKGHYIVDEKDSIRLDAYLIGGKLFSQFEVEGTMLLTTDYREGDALISEIVAGPAKEIAITGGHTKETPPVRSYAVRTRQVAVMHRQKVAPTNTPTPKK